MENFTKETLELLSKYHKECKSFVEMKKVFESLVIREDCDDVVATYCDKYEDNRNLYDIVAEMYDKYPFFFEMVHQMTIGSQVTNYGVFCEQARNFQIDLEDEEYNLIVLALNNGFFTVKDKEEKIQEMNRRFRELSRVGTARVIGTVNSFTDAVTDASKRFTNHVIDVIEVDRDEFDKQMNDASLRFEQLKDDGYRMTKKALNKGTKKLIKVLEKVVEKTEK